MAAQDLRPQGQIRQSQIITTFGPGAMVDLPRYAVVIGGLEHWKSRGPAIWSIFWCVVNAARAATWSLHRNGGRPRWVTAPASVHGSDRRRRKIAVTAKRTRIGCWCDRRVIRTSLSS